MGRFIVSLRRDYGYLSFESEDEKDLLENVRRLTKLGKLVDQTFGSTVDIPEDVIRQAGELTNMEKVLVVLSRAGRPLERREYISLGRRLGVPVGWWNGSNFVRDMKKLPQGVVLKIPNGGKRWKLKLSRSGARYAKSILKRANKSSNTQDLGEDGK